MIFDELKIYVYARGLQRAKREIPFPELSR